MTTRHLEPTPGWCERAYDALESSRKTICYCANGSKCEPCSLTSIYRNLRFAKPAPEPVVRESRKTDEPVQEQTVARADVERANVRSKEYWDSLERVAAVVRSWPKWMRGETTLPKPAAKDAELPELSTLPDAILKFANGMFPDDTLAMVRALQFANAILAEVDRRIKAHALADGEDTIPRIGQIAREVAREEIGKARVQIKRLDDGWDDYNFGRIVPGEK